ncbi:MAG: hypothetical protein ACOYBC_07390 [Bilifractor sp.]|jgi:hypothetical protein
MKWYKELFTGKEAAKNAGRLIRNAEQGKFDPGLYLITLSSNGTDELDLVLASSIRGKKTAISRMPLVVGIAIGKHEAVQVAGEIARCAYFESGAASIRQWILDSVRTDAKEDANIPETGEREDSGIPGSGWNNV